jgi:hypothetical protein
MDIDNTLDSMLRKKDNANNWFDNTPIEGPPRMGLGSLPNTWAGNGNMGYHDKYVDAGVDLNNAAINGKVNGGLFDLYGSFSNADNTFKNGDVKNFNYGLSTKPLGNTGVNLFAEKNRTFTPNGIYDSEPTYGAQYTPNNNWSVKGSTTDNKWMGRSFDGGVNYNKGALNAFANVHQDPMSGNNYKAGLNYYF